MNKDQFEGAVRDVAGKAQQALGMATGSAKTRFDGATREVSGKGQYAYGSARDVAEDVSRHGEEAYSRASQRFEHGTRVATRQIEHHPLTSLLLAGAAGYLIGLLVHGRS